jgi:hypothetical protein
MSTNNVPVSSWFSQVEVSPGTLSSTRNGTEERGDALREILAAQDRTNELLEELIDKVTTVQRQKQAELKKWKDAHPRLAEACRRAAEALGRVQIDFLDRLTEEIEESADDMVDGDFLLGEFVDRFGPRLAHINGVLQVLAQLASTAEPAAAHQEDDAGA